MKKLLTILGAVGLTATSAATVVACGDNNRNEVTKIDLQSLNKETIRGSVEITEEQAVKEFLENNPSITNVADFKTDVAISLIKPTLTADGQLFVVAKSESANYSGGVVVNVAAINKTDLALMVTTKTIQGNDKMTKDDALKSLAQSLGWGNLSDFVEVTSFKAPNHKKKINGSLTVTAKTSTQYFGSVVITIEY